MLKQRRDEDEVQLILSLIIYVGATLTVVTHATEDEDNINNYILVWFKLLYNTNTI